MVESYKFYPLYEENNTGEFHIVHSNVLSYLCYVCACMCVRKRARVLGNSSIVNASGITNANNYTTNSFIQY